MPKVLNGIGRVFTIQEIAQALEVSELTIRKYYREGRLKGQKIGKTVFVTESVLKDFLEGKTPEPEEKKTEDEKKPDKVEKPEEKSTE
ncbi:MAG: helix-turn-helix domain-containing protein [Candidatus Aminicenantes bacterium]|nr:helix-turn-helix domain-containing protein [Candidatus Aminicenantes bacterium]